MKNEVLKIDDIEVIDEEIVTNETENHSTAIETQDIFLGNPETVGQLIGLLSVYDKLTPLYFSNQTRQTLYEKIICGEIIIYFKP